MVASQPERACLSRNASTFSLRRGQYRAGSFAAWTLRRLSFGTTTAKPDCRPSRMVPSADGSTNSSARSASAAATPTTRGSTPFDLRDGRCTARSCSLMASSESLPSAVRLSAERRAPSEPVPRLAGITML
jgi:hypothetical protein